MELLTLFLSFCQIGFTSFGGFSMVPLINSEMLSHGWMTASEVADIVAIAEMTPGPLGLNCATFAGMRVAGILGAVVANLGVLSPSFTLCAVAAYFFEKSKNSPMLKNVLFAVRPVSLGLICAVVLDLLASNYGTFSSPDFACIAVFAVSCYLLFKRKWNVPKVIAVSALIGILFCR